MKNKFLVMTVICMLFTTILGNTKLTAYAAYASDYFIYDAENFTINKVNPDTGDVYYSFCLDDESINRIKSGYGCYISSYVSSGSYKLSVYTLPKDVILATGKYSVDGYTGTKVAVKPYTLDFEEIPSSELDMRVVYCGTGSTSSTTPPLSLSFSEVALTASGTTSVIIDYVETISSSEQLSRNMIYSTLNIYHESSGAFNILHLGEVVPDAWAETFTEIEIKTELGKIYEEPDVNSTYVCGASAGTIIQIGKSTVVDGIVWFKAKLENRHGTFEGYIQASDVISGGSSSEGGDSSSSEIYANAIITGGIAILLEEPSLSSSTLDYIPSGTAVVVIGSVVENDSGEKYYYTRYIEETTEKYGYVPAQYISFDFSGSGSGSGSIGGSSSDNILGNTGIFDVDSEDFKDSLSNAGESLEGILGFITKIPVVIGQIFSFLPDWCLTIVGLSFTLSALLLIYKLIRG